jgi:hypothetical protein
LGHFTGRIEVLQGERVGRNKPLMRGSEMTGFNPCKWITEM